MNSLITEPIIMSNEHFNILITGSDGQLGKELKGLSNHYSYNCYFTSRKELDISETELIKDFVKKNDINVIINCAAYTAVDKAEVEQELANSINHLAVRNLGAISKALDIKLIHISTDYVFNGTNYKPYLEADTLDPKSIYGKTKLDGELSLLDINPKNSIIIRTSWVYSSFGNNFVKTMLRLGREKESLGVIFDQVGTPTYAKDLAKTILDIIPKINNGDVEIYHYSNEGVASWYDFSKQIMEFSDLKCKINPIMTVDYPTPALRPHYSILNKSKIKSKFNLHIPYWKDSLKDCLALLGDKSEK